MWYKPYGKTGKEISVVSFGGMRFPDHKDWEVSARIVRHAHSKGINYFDTAPGYGKSEDIFGVAFRKMDRSTFYVSTKSMASDAKGLRADLEKSLQRMGVDYLDFFHIWCLVAPKSWTERKTGGAVAEAQKLQKEGLFRHLVVSAHLAGKDLREVLEDGVFEGATLGYCAINFPYRQEAVDAAGKLGLGVVAMNPIGGGIIPKNAERFGFLRGPEDPSVVAAAIRFVVSDPSVTSALVGFSSNEHVDQAVRAVEGFRPYDRQRIRQLQSRITESFNGLCTGCGYCLPCPQGVDIPRMMDAYNHKLIGSGEDKEITNRLKWHWGLEAKDAAACALCGKCEETCTQHLPIMERMKHIAALAEADKPKT